MRVTKPDFARASLHDSESMIEQKLAPRQDGPEKVLQRLAPRRLRVGSIFQNRAEALQFGGRRLAAQGEVEDTADRVGVADILFQPRAYPRVRVAQLVVEGLAVVQVKGLPDGRL